RYEYSPNGNLIKVVDGLGNVAEYDYDALGNLIKVTRVGDEERLNQVTKYIWNKNGQVTDVINPAGERESYEYDLAGRMVKKTDRDGYETKIGYDKNSLLSRITYSDSSEVEFSYDALAHLKEMKDWNGTTCIVNDALGRALEVTDPNGNLVKYEWGANGEKRKLIYPNGEEVSYNYNDRGLLSELITENGKVAYDYDAMGRIMSKTLPNGIISKYEYNSIGRLSSLSHIGENIHDVYKYEYDLAGNKIAAIKERENMPSDSGRFEYGYDALNQLISVTKDGKLQREYTYDAFGNRSSKKSYDVADKMIETLYKYNNKNQLLAETTGDVTKNYTYDLRGNIKTVTTGQDLIRNFTYDARNMLSEVSEKINGITQKASYNYNGLGKRMGQRVHTPSDPEKVIRYTLDLTRDYHNMLTLSTESKGRNQADNYFYDFNVVGMSRAVGDDYFIQDDLGSPMSVINQRGELDEAYAYDEFGQEYCNIIDARNRFQPLSYTGYQKEAVGDTYFAQARRYDASIGRFVSEDKIKGDLLLPTSLNAYDYCWNRPSVYIDLNGHIPCAGITQVQYQSLGNDNQNTKQSFISVDEDSVYSANNMATYTIGTADVINRSVEQGFIKRAYNMPRPKNIGKIGWARMVNKDIDYTRNVAENLGGFVRNIGKLADGVFLVLDISDDVSENIEKQATPEEYIADIVGDVGIFAAGIGIGSFIGSIVPGPGTIIGAVVGLCVALGYSILTESLLINGHTIKDWLKIGLKNVLTMLTRGTYCVTSA
ncbi:MAG: RHS repeat protein, partial [Lachnospiraceae bacterium]|nr:RHS repeat protein [Lachnospiraceae bacterium]